MQLNAKTVHLTDAEKQQFEENEQAITASMRAQGLTDTQIARAKKIHRSTGGRDRVVMDDGSVKDPAYAVIKKFKRESAS